MIDHNYEACETEYLEMEAVFAELNEEQSPAEVTDLPEWASFAAGAELTEAFWALWRADKDAVKANLSERGFYVKKTSAGWKLRSKRIRYKGARACFSSRAFYYREAALKDRIRETDHWSENAA